MPGPTFEIFVPFSSHQSDTRGSYTLRLTNHSNDLHPDLSAFLPLNSTASFWRKKRSICCWWWLTTAVWAAYVYS